MFRRLVRGVHDLSKSSTLTGENVVKSRFPEIKIPSVTLDEYIFSNTEKWPEKTALECAETGRTITYQQLEKRSLSLAKFLRGPLGLAKGDTIAVILRNIPEYAVIVLGGSAAGLKVTTVNPFYTLEEIRGQLISSKSKLVVTLPELCDKVAKSTNGISQDKIPLVLIKDEINTAVPQDAILLDEIYERDYEVALKPVNLEETCLLPYSSGTTGLPKGVELTHRNLVANLCQSAHPDLRITVETGAHQQDVLPLFLPLFHIYGLAITMLSMLSHGCKLVTFPKYGIGPLIKFCENYKPTIVHAVPPIILALAGNAAIKPKHLETIRDIASAAAPLGAADVERFHRKSGGKTNLIQLYGLTETSPVVALQSSKLEGGIKIGGSGFMVPNTECKVVPLDESEHPGLGPNETGELLFKGPQVMKGYHNNEEATRGTFTKDRWLRTGDIGYYDEDGHFFITDRLKELIKVKGFQVPPAELEEILRDHPSVADAAVIGVPDSINGEVPKAYVVLKDNEKVQPTVLEEYVNGRVVDYKKLRGGIAFIDNIPKNDSGKIMRRRLKELSSDTL